MGPETMTKFETCPNQRTHFEAVYRCSMSNFLFINLNEFVWSVWLHQVYFYPALFKVAVKRDVMYLRSWIGFGVFFHL